MNLDEVVIFRQSELIIYPNDSKKPAIGCELNRPALVTLYNVWPENRSIFKDPKSQEFQSFVQNLKMKCEKQLVEFIDYELHNGELIFRTMHFSRYSFVGSVRIKKTNWEQLAPLVLSILFFVLGCSFYKL